MGRGDYGKTPNVWRPSEVVQPQVPGGDPWNSGLVTTTTVTEYGYPPLGGSADAFGWVARQSFTLTHTVTIPNATTSTIVGDTQPPTTFGWQQASPFMLIVLRGEIDYTGASNTIFDTEWNHLAGGATWVANGGLAATPGNVTGMNFIYAWFGCVNWFTWTRLSAHLIFSDANNLQGAGQGASAQNVNTFAFWSDITAVNNLNDDTTNNLSSTLTRKIRFVCRNNSALGSFTVKPTLLQVLTPPNGFLP